MKLTKAILERIHRVPQVTSKWKMLKRPVYLLRAIEVWAIFDTQIDITWLYFGKSCEITIFRNPTEVSQNASTSISKGPSITK